MTSCIICAECGEAHGRISQLDMDRVVSEYLQVTGLASGALRSTLEQFLTACRYFIAQPCAPDEAFTSKASDEVFHIVHHFRPPVVWRLPKRCASEVLQLGDSVVPPELQVGDSVLCGGREYFWDGEEWIENGYETRSQRGNVK